MIHYVPKGCPACRASVRITMTEWDAGATRHARCALPLRNEGSLPYLIASRWYALRRTLGVPAEPPLGR